MTGSKPFRLLIGSAIAGGAVFLFFEYLFKAPVFVKVFGFLVLLFILYLVVDWMLGPFRGKRPQE